MFKYLVIVGCWIAFVVSTDACARTERPESFMSLQFENDNFTIIDDIRDQYYTNGLSLSILRLEKPPAWLGELVNGTPLSSNADVLDLVQHTVGHKIYTPKNTFSSTVVANDRPYAGYLYYSISSVSNTRQSETIDYGNRVEVTFGVVGPGALGEGSQSFVHELMGVDTPNGWDNQLKNEPILGISYSKLWRRVKPASNGLMMGVNRHDTIALGNGATYVASGAMLRLGNNLKRDLAPPTISPGFPGSPYFQPGRQSSWYLYLGFEARLVLRDIFLDGNTFSNSHSVDRELLVGDTQFGFVYMVDDVRIALSKVFRTNEFTTQAERDVFGGINLSVHY